MVTRRRRKVWADKAALLAGGGEVEALPYARASQDKKEQGKSCADQTRLNRFETNRYGWYVEREYEDSDKSASRFARKVREDYEEMLEAIRAGRGDVLVMYELARGQRDLEVYVQIRALRQAMRLSVRTFADKLGVGHRTVGRWEASGADAELRPDSQAFLDTMLCPSHR